jgi:hypothetical protein
MKKRGDACSCVVRFLNQFPRLGVNELNGLRYEDDICLVECNNSVIKAYSYEVVSGTKYRNGECVMTIW